nr:RNA-directed DNA polymerase, eukaryota [Tanacetum cinerariifolium]
MESICSTFFNGADPSERKITWVAWEKVLASKKNGGLGVSSFHALNRALLLKWVWRFLSQDGSIWSRVISAIYGPSLEHHQNTWLWSDTWISDLPLCVRFPRLFALEEDKEVSVASKLGSSLVDSSFRRPVRNGIVRQQWLDLSSLLESVILSPSKYRWFCDLNGEGAFRVKDARSIIDDIFLPSSEVATRWVKYIPIKINIFMWRARLNRIPTRCNLASHDVVLESSLCPLCGLAPEDASHVLFRCELSKHVFRRICQWWDLDWQDVLSFPDWDGWFANVRLPNKLKLLLEGVFYAAWWHIWIFRNHSIFDETPPRRSMLFNDIVAWCFTWCGSRCNSLCSWDCWLKTLI